MSRKTKRLPSPGIRQGSPSFRHRAALPLAEIPVPDRTAALLVNQDNSYIRSYSLGPCKILVTKEFGRWHLSISCPDRYPNWDEIAEARYRLLPPELTFGMPLPPMEEYINLHRNTFHLYQATPGGTLGPFA